jgi:flagellar biosynthesis protein FliP
VAPIVRAALAVGLLWASLATPAHAQTLTDPPVTTEVGLESPSVPVIETPRVGEVPEVPGISVQVNGVEGGLTQSVTLVLMLGMGALIPALLLLCTSFTRFIVVLGLTRNALGIQTAPPTQVLLGLSLFLTVFVMRPVLTEVWDQGVQPMMDEEITFDEAYDRSYGPLRDFMLAQTREEDLALFLDLADGPQPESPQEIGASVLVPAFVVSELRTAFVIGFIVFIPFLVIDMIVSTVLMSLGMVMLPPTFVSLPLKLLVFVLVDGWVLLIGSLVSSVNGVGG